MVGSNRRGQAMLLIAIVAVVAVAPILSATETNGNVVNTEENIVVIPLNKNQTPTKYLRGGTLAKPKDVVRDYYIYENVVETIRSSVVSEYSRPETAKTITNQNMNSHGKPLFVGRTTSRYLSPVEDEKPEMIYLDPDCTIYHVGEMKMSCDTDLFYSSKRLRCVPPEYVEDECDSDGARKNCDESTCQVSKHGPEVKIGNGASNPQEDDGSFKEPKSFSSTENVAATFQGESACYMTNWAIYRAPRDHYRPKFQPEYIDPHLCTTLIYSFFGINEDYEVLSTDAWADYKEEGKGGLDQLARVLAKRGVGRLKRVTIAIGGWNDSFRSRFVWRNLLALNENGDQARLQFAINVAIFLAKYQLDGLDIDYEFPACLLNNCDELTKHEREGFVLLMRELRNAFDVQPLQPDKRLWLTVAMSANPRVIERGYDLANLMQYVDKLHLMSYDYYGGAFSNVVAHNQPKRTPEGVTDMLSVEDSVKVLLKNGALAEKIVVGFPSYGRGFRPKDSIPSGGDGKPMFGRPNNAATAKFPYTQEYGIASFWEICQIAMYQSAKHGVRDAFYVENEGSYLPYENGESLMSYSDIRDALAIREMVNRMGLGGVMIYTLDFDDFNGMHCGCGRFPLLRALLGNSDGEESCIGRIQRGVKVATGVLSKPNVHCYISNWARYRLLHGDFDITRDTDVNSCDTIVYAFADVRKNAHDAYEIVSTDSHSDIVLGGYKQAVDLIGRGAVKRVLLSLPGYKEDVGVFETLANSPVSTKIQFANSVVAFLKSYGFSGLDIDLEQSGSSSSPLNIVGRFAQPLYDALSKENMVLTVAKYVWDYPQDFNHLLDSVHVMSYQWSNGESLNHFQPINQVRNAMLQSRNQSHYVGVSTYGWYGQLDEPNAAKLPVEQLIGKSTEKYKVKHRYTDRLHAASLLEACMDKIYTGMEFDSTYMKPGDGFYFAFTDGKTVSGQTTPTHVRSLEKVRKELELPGFSVWTADLSDTINLCGCGRFPILTTLAFGSPSNSSCIL